MAFPLVSDEDHVWIETGWTILRRKGHAVTIGGDGERAMEAVTGCPSWR